MTATQALVSVRRGLAPALAATLCVAAAQEPQTTVRGVLNGVTMQSAPATVARGGIVAVTGADLASAEAAAAGTPLPLALGEPPVEILINGVPAPLFFVSPGQINAQVPWEVEPGWAEVTVRRGGTDSAAMPVVVVDANPNLFTHEGTSSLIAQEPATPASGRAAPLSVGGPGGPRSAEGAVLGANAVFEPGQTITIFGAGIGETDPPLATGMAGPDGAGSVPVEAQRAFIGGLPAAVSSVRASEEIVGLYEMDVTLPELAQSGELLHWYSGNSSGSAVLGSAGDPTYRFMSVSAENGPVQRVDLSDLNPYFVVATGSLDEAEFCYQGLQILDFRRETSRALEHCLFPSFPLTANAAQYRPFESAPHSPVLAALTEPVGEAASGVTNSVLLIDTATGSETLLAHAPGADRLQPGTGNSSVLRLERPGAPGAYDLLAPSGEPAGEQLGNAPLPDLPLGIEGGPQAAQQVGLGGGYRMRFPRGDEAVAVLYNQRASEIARVPFPEGWLPLSPPRRLSFQGIPAGNALGPATYGFPGDRSVYVIARAADGSADAVVAFRPVLSADSEAPPPDTVAVTTELTPLPAGSFAASCTDQVRWQRLPLTRTLAIVGAGEAYGEWSGPQASSVCLGDRVILYDTTTKSFESVDAPARLRVAEKGALRSYLYFGDGEGTQPLAAAEALHVYDGVARTFSKIELPAGVGISLAEWPQQLAGTARLVAVATGGPPRTNPRTGAIRPPFAGNRGLLVVDLPNGTARHLALPEGYQRIHPGNFALIRDGRRAFGAIPILGRVFARGIRPNAGPGQPGGSGMLTWSIETGESVEIPLPDGALSVIQAVGPGSAQQPMVWDYAPRSGAFAFGVFDPEGTLFSVGVVGL